MHTSFFEGVLEGQEVPRLGRPMTRPAKRANAACSTTPCTAAGCALTAAPPYTPTALAAVCLGAERSARQLQRGISGAIALLLRAAEAGGGMSRDVLLEAVTGAERHAMRWALRDVGEGPLSPERCRQGRSSPVCRPMSAVGQRILAIFSGFVLVVVVFAAAWYYASAIKDQALVVEIA